MIEILQKLKPLLHADLLVSQVLAPSYTTLKLGDNQVESLVSQIFQVCKNSGFEEYLSQVDLKFNHLIN